MRTERNQLSLAELTAFAAIKKAFQAGTIDKRGARHVFTLLVDGNGVNISAPSGRAASRRLAVARTLLDSEGMTR